MPQTPNIPRELGAIQVLIRVALRLIILGAFAALGSQGFAKTFTNLLMLGAIYCAFVGAVRREPIDWHSLNHWDEAAIYAVMAYFAAAST
jgi:hypothetical protein